MNAEHYNEMPEELRKQLEDHYKVTEHTAGELAPETKLKLFEPLSNEELRYRRQQQFKK